MAALPVLGQGTLTIEITNIKDPVGNILIGLFDNETDFLKKTVQSKVVAASGPNVIVVFEGIPSGDYGVSVVHDKNKNGEMDMSWLGIPKEGFGFGNNARGTFGPPSFKDTIIHYKGEAVRTEIKLMHF